ncbi:hypothetical protein BST81_04575 [Leptolyngbya sp. 'hensonii']|uniref:DUF1818 family protein n=1 Tax=Leptolyngbya sp. 'hensonii' TaxID=1922337 RepID=UPI0009500DE1|nr:DUF1818 family protein [Leptolyngbya sp. 'hensonii']OLP19550.1 hypothetical protein BST81_04575 [Leptolyngbya sp. 'hensonii']
MERVVKSGTGWRLGWDGTAAVFKGLVGGEDWALELTEAELEDFRRLVSQLAETLSQMASELMDQEKIACEVESELLWLGAEGYPQAYNLRLLLLTGRRAEGFWSETAVPELIQSAQMLHIF